MNIEFENLQKERSKISVISAKDDGKHVVVAGWLYDSRDLGKVRFVVLRDMSGEIQITAHKDKTDKKLFDSLGGASRESSIVVSGTVKKSDKAPGGREIVPSSFDVVGAAESPLPIDTSDFSKTELPKRLDYRFLDMHRKRTQSIFKIQSTISRAFLEHFHEKEFIEMQPPCVIGAASEGGTDLFEVKYFEKKAYLAQSPQLYKQMLACSMEKICMICPVWRAEKHNTVRHINEIRQMDIEMAFADQTSVMKHLEDVVKYIVEQILRDNKEDLELMGVKLKVPSAKYLHYDETIKLLKKEKIKIEIGD